VDIEKQIRKLARSIYWQNIYKSAKEIGSIQLFENQTNFSGLQSLFLFWLSIYDSLYQDLTQKEWKYLDENVINSDIRCDAFYILGRKFVNNKLIIVKEMSRLVNLNLKINQTSAHLI
jgi:hypothetical protein